MVIDPRRFRDARRTEGRAPGTPENRTHSQGELTKAQRLDHVVVDAELEGHHAVDLVIGVTDEDDWKAAEAGFETKRAQYLGCGATGKGRCHERERRRRIECAHQLLVALGDLELEAFAPQEVRQTRCFFGVLFSEEDSMHGMHEEMNLPGLCDAAVTPTFRRSKQHANSRVARPDRT